MRIIKSLFGSSNQKPLTLDDFWKWFTDNEKSFYKVVKSHTNIEKDFLDKLSQKLNELGDGYWFLTGMKDEDTAELIITADGHVKNIAAIEELMAAAPKLLGWKFTALKPAITIENLKLEMHGYTFNAENLSFYPIEHSAYPDEIDIVIVHDDYSEDNQNEIKNGTFIFLDNYLGELRNVTMIDHVQFVAKENAEKELIPIAKLNDYLNWREKEFIEKYDGLRRNTEEDAYSLFEANLENDLPLIATINTSVLDWDSKPSHPWIVVVQIKYNGDKNNGMPDEPTYQLLNNIEDDILEHLKDSEGNLYIGRETANSLREIYFACIDFRHPSKVLKNIIQTYDDKIDIQFDIYKDKYWQSFTRFQPSL